jgi:ATP-dependent Clp protease ATP-binding subunit ClpA
VVERQVENALARRILAGEFAEGERALVDYADGAYTFTKVADRPAAASA